MTSPGGKSRPGPWHNPYLTSIEDVYIAITGSIIGRLSGSYMGPVDGDVTISVTGADRRFQWAKRGRRCNQFRDCPGWRRRFHLDWRLGLCRSGGV